MQMRDRASGGQLARPLTWLGQARPAVLLGLLLVPIGVLLSAIPYGGGGVPVELRWLLMAVQVLGLVALATMCRRGPPAQDEVQVR